MKSKHLKLKKAYQNNIDISDKNLGNKYTHFEDSKLDESKTLLYEIILILHLTKDLQEAK